jgi:hypothetical protein
MTRQSQQEKHFEPKYMLIVRNSRSSEPTERRTSPKCGSWFMIRFGLALISGLYDHKLLCSNSGELIAPTFDYLRYCSMLRRAIVNVRHDLWKAYEFSLLEPHFFLVSVLLFSNKSVFLAILRISEWVIRLNWFDESYFLWSLSWRLQYVRLEIHIRPVYFSYYTKSTLF